MVATAVLIGTLAAAAPQARDARAPQTDQTVPVTRGTRLLVNNFAGEVVVRAWDKDSLRVQAHHSSRIHVSLRNGDGTLRVSSASSTGPEGSVDYEISAPAWMAVRVDGQYNFVTVEGSQGEVAINTVRGDIVVKGAGGAVTAKTIEGEVTIE
jgi:hypothetical protein